MSLDFPRVACQVAPASSPSCVRWTPSMTRPPPALRWRSGGRVSWLWRATRAATTSTTFRDSGRRLLPQSPPFYPLIDLFLYFYFFLSMFFGCCCRPQTPLVFFFFCAAACDTKMEECNCKSVKTNHKASAVTFPQFLLCYVSCVDVATVFRVAPFIFIPALLFCPFFNHVPVFQYLSKTVSSSHFMLKYNLLLRR